METPLTPAVFWKYSLSKEEIPLTPRGPVGGAPVGTLALALRAAAVRRVDARESVFVIIYDIAGWWIYEFNENRIGSVDLNEIAMRDLPLAADPQSPRTYIIDASGFIGAVRRDQNQYSIVSLTLKQGRILEQAGPAGAPFRIQYANDPELLTIEDPAVPANPVTGFVVPRTMRNHGKNIEWTPNIAFKPGPSLDTLSRGVAWMHKNLPPNAKIRAVGSLHSWSPVMRCDDVTILPGGWAGVAPIAAEECNINNNERPAYYRILAGTRIREINEELQKRGRAIPYLGGFDGQTIGGVLPTGTHGSVLRFGPLVDMICSIDLVAFDGKILRIEPNPAFTNGDYLKIHRPNIKLTIDDELFHCARLGLGAFGVIHSLVIKTVPKFWLREVRTVANFNDLRPKLANGGIFKIFLNESDARSKLEDPNFEIPAGGAAPFDGHPAQMYHFELLWNPYSGKTLLTSRHFVTKEIRKELEAAEQAEPGVQKERNIFKFGGPNFDSPEFNRPGFQEFASGAFGEEAIGVLQAIAKNKPKAIPNIIDSTIDGLSDKNGFIQKSYKVFNIGKEANLLPALSSTISVPLDGDAWLRATDIIAKVAKLHLEKGIVETAPIAMRFVAKSSAPLADPDHNCKFELIFGGNDKDTNDRANILIKAYYDALRAELGDGVRFHFGQMIPEGTLDTKNGAGDLPMKASYPNYARWRARRDELDPLGRGLTPWLQKIIS